MIHDGITRCKASAVNSGNGSRKPAVVLADLLRCWRTLPSNCSHNHDNARKVSVLTKHAATATAA